MSVAKKIAIGTAATAAVIGGVYAAKKIKEARRNNYFKSNSTLKINKDGSADVFPTLTKFMKESNSSKATIHLNNIKSNAKEVAKNKGQIKLNNTKLEINKKDIDRYINSFMKERNTENAASYLKNIKKTARENVDLNALNAELIKKNAKLLKK